MTVNATTGQTVVPVMAFCTSCRRDMLLVPVSPVSLDTPGLLDGMKHALVASVSAKTKKEKKRVSNSSYHPVFYTQVSRTSYFHVFIRCALITSLDTSAPVEATETTVTTVAITIDNQLSHSFLAQSAFDIRVLEAPYLVTGTTRFPPENVPSQTNRYNNGGLFTSSSDSAVEGLIGYILPGGTQTVVLYFTIGLCSLIAVDTLEELTPEIVAEARNSGKSSIRGSFVVDGIPYRYHVSDNGLTTLSFTEKLLQSFAKFQTKTSPTGDSEATQCYMTMMCVPESSSFVAQVAQLSSSDE